MPGGADWMQTYGHPVPWDLALEPMPVHRLIEDAAARAPDAACIDFLGRITTYAEIAGAVDKAARGFQILGVRRGIKVGLFLPNCPQYVIAYYAIMKAGGTAVNFSPLYTADELRHQVEDSETDIMVCLDVAQLYPTIAEVLESSRLRCLVVGSLADVLPAGKALLYRMFKRRERSKVKADLRHIRFPSLLENDGLEDAPEIDVHGDIALLQYTGGTTGTPKGAVLTHANLSINAQQVQAIDPEPDVEDRILGALPLFHVFANTCVLNRTVLRGGEMVLLPKFELGLALETIQRRRITALPGVPTMYQAFLDSPKIAKFDLTSIRACISGGAPMPAELKTRFEAKTQAKVVEGYGLTESAGVVSVNPYETGGKPGSIGQPIPGTRIVIVDKEDPSKPAPDGEPGEITVAGPQIMRGYWKKDEATKEAFIDGRLRTGDVGYIDADGYVYVVDRLKDMIVVGGFKAFPSQLEAVLYKNDAVKEAIVIGVPDPYLGERPKAFVTLQPGADATEKALLDYLNAHVGKHERAVAVEIRETLPKTMIGKLSRKELVAEARARYDATRLAS
ncbi:long-chain-fatty-acid--CoA ligase [Sphingosinicella microcystinivorans]|uniref:long-chain-fatty-acid--CoA ligase n=1 Tax=Sphingosinicella microcystinivorans TaxID=335406 RepID=UPI0022F3E996|nr:long-chain fatty acid--CoA ligase [Sphingosinicella microcystinivorans]WBX85752.1 long-chain fatty acid--CoA ligase [Sphingosinicella microcystinivorans]